MTYSVSGGGGGGDNGSTRIWTSAQVVRRDTRRRVLGLVHRMFARVWVNLRVQICSTLCVCVREVETLLRVKISLRNGRRAARVN